MDTEKDRKELHDESNQGEPEDDRNTEPVTNITPHVTNPSPKIILIWRTRSLHDHDHVPIEDRERRERIVTSLVTIANSTIGGLICDHLLKYGGATIPELEEVIPTTKATASRTLKSLMNNDVVERKGKVGPPYRPQGQSGPRIPIFIWKGADNQASIEAQKRYGASVVRARDLTLKLERQQREAQNEAQALEAKNLVEVRALEVKKLAGQVLDALPPNHDKLQLTPIYDAMNDLDVDPALREDVKTVVIRSLQAADTVIRRGEGG